MRKRREIMWAVMVLSAAARPSAGQSAESPDQITPTDVYREVQAVARDIEQIRFYMGRPRNAQPPIEVSGVAPREVIYQAATLCEKANRLSYELIREISEKPIVPTGEIVPADVLRMVRIARDRVRETRRRIVIAHPSRTTAERLGIELTPDDLPTTEKVPTDVYKAVVQLNRQINLLLDQRFSPSDVYEQVSLAIAYAARVRSRWPGPRIPAEPPWELGKRPADVYARLLSCVDLVGQIAQKADVQMLQLSVSESGLEQVTPSDVYDIASLLVSELAYLDQTLNDTSSQRKARYPGRKVPSDVYQRAGILKKQLEEINQRIVVGTTSGKGGT